jgi:hypothetical protein
MMAAGVSVPKAGEAKVTARFSWLLGILLVALTVPALAATASDEVVVVLSFSPAQLSIASHEGYDVVSLEGAEHLTEPGEPMLPAVNVQILLPSGADASGLTVGYRGTTYLSGVYRVQPAPRPATFSARDAAEIPQPNAQTYSSVLPYPREIARLAGVGDMAGYRIASIEVAPVQYVPATGELLLHTEIEITITTVPAEDSDARSAASEAVRGAVERAVVNADELSSYCSPPSGRAPRTGAFDYLIVCPAAFADEFQPLADWKTRKGVRTEIVTLESIAADPAFQGVDLAESVRKCIRQHHIDLGITWVLLGGDTDVVPTRNAYDFFYNQGIPCDLYFADLNGTWNADGDARWGEQGEDGIDMYSDVFVGRAPAGTEQEAARFVEKVLAYEGATLSVADDFELEMLFLGEVMWSSPDPYTDGAVALDMIDAGYVPPRFDPITKLYESQGTLRYATAVAALSAGCGIVAHQGHSNISAASIGPDNLTIATLDGLTNGDRGGVWYSVGCWSAAIDNDAFGEHWVTSPGGGGVAYIGNSRYGWGCPGHPGECVSDLYSQQFMNSLMTKDLVHAGLVHADAKHHFVGQAKLDGYMRYAMYELNLLGDPEMPIWTDRPQPLVVSHPEAVAIVNGSATLDVTVASGGSPVVGATACLATADGEVYDVGETDGAGRTTFTVAAGAPCSATLTVTAHNFVPYGATVAIGWGLTDVPDGGGPIAATALFQNQPNPFFPATSIAFNVAERARVSITVYDLSGRRVAVLLDREVDPGVSSIRWDGRDESGRDVAAGTYFARMIAGSSHFEMKMSLLR